MFFYRLVPFQAARILACGLVVVLVAGCGNKPKLPPMAEASGIVTLDGQPLVRGMVQFLPDTAKGTQGPPASGPISPDGHFTLQIAGVSGALVGWHKVAVESRKDVDLNKESWAPSLIPEKYSNPNQSGLAFEVKAGQHNEYKLELSSKP